MNWKFWAWRRYRLTPERREEICRSLEEYLRSGGQIWKVMNFRLHPQVAVATGIPFGDLWKFRQHVSFGMRKRLRQAGENGTSVRIERRLASL